MAPTSAASEFKLSQPRAAQLSQWESLSSLRQAGAFCDVAVDNGNGERISAHALVLGAASSKLKKQLEEAAAAGAARPLLITIDASADALKAVITYIYEGNACVGAHAVAHVVRVARRWELSSLQDALVPALLENLSPVVATGLFALGEPFGEQLGAAARTYLLANFPDCAMAEPYGRWPATVLKHILNSDDLVLECEETALIHLARWARASTGRDKASLAVLPSMRWALLSLPALDALCERKAGADSFCEAVSDHCAEARNVHRGTVSTGSEPFMPQLRKCYVGWWAGMGSATRGGAVVAGRGAAGKAGIVNLKPRAVRPHEGTLLFLNDADQPSCVFQWFLRAHCGRSIAGRGSRLEGVELEEIADVCSGTDDAVYVLDRDAEHVVRVCHGEAEVVGKGRLRLQRPSALAVGRDGALFVLEAHGAHVVQFADGRMTGVAGSAEMTGDSAAELNAGLSGRICVSPSGRLYVSDTQNHRVQRWDPGSKEGVTVAGGRGCGAGQDQLNHPGGICVGDDGTLFIADTGNHRVVKWSEGASAGVTAAGGYGPGDGLHQLREPLDVALEPLTGGLLVADWGNARVVRWAMPEVPAGLLAAVRGESGR